MWVVKFGGSLVQSSKLTRWLEALAQTDAIIVPGGGPFADAVRGAQARWGFDERTAHRMAILGMRQYGLMLIGLRPELLAATLEGCSNPGGQARVWLPMPEDLDAFDIPATWDISSDSLAAWLTGQLHAAHLLLVKSIAPSSHGNGERSVPQEITCEQLVNKKWVDPVFYEYGASGLFQSWLCGPDSYTGLACSLADPNRHFTRIHFAKTGKLHRHDQSFT